MVFISRVSAVQIRPLLQIKKSPDRGTFLFVWVRCRTALVSETNAGSSGDALLAAKYRRKARATPVAKSAQLRALHFVEQAPPSTLLDELRQTG